MAHKFRKMTLTQQRTYPKGWNLSSPAGFAKRRPAARHAAHSEIYWAKLIFQSINSASKNFLKFDKVI